MREGTVIAGKYRLERPLARGGMGAVWVARHLQLDEQVAVKFMDISLPSAADARVRFEREAKSAARIRSPHVVQILDHGVDGEIPYIVMELLEGEHLGTRLKRESRLSLIAAAIITEQVTKALHRAHKAGIIHRDLKPANVFLAHVDDDDEIVKILDFGIVKSMTGGGGLSGEATKSDVLMGSPNYMSPEQARGARSVDHRTDLWSLGVVLFRAITGRMAFSGESVVDVILKICTGPIPVPTAAAPDLPPEVDAFFLRALDRDTSRRFSSAREMGAEFSALVQSLGPRANVVGPRPPSSAEPSHAQSVVQEVAVSEGAISSAPSTPEGTLRWRQLLQTSGGPSSGVETPTMPHARMRLPSSTGAPSGEAHGRGARSTSESQARAGAPPTAERAAKWHAPPSEGSASLAALLKPPAAETSTGGSSLAALLRPPSGSPAHAAPALLKPPASPSYGKASGTPVPPAVKGAMLPKLPGPPSPRPGRALLEDVDVDPADTLPQSDRDPSAFIRLTSTAGPTSTKAPQSDRSAEIAQFIDEAFLALQASDPIPECGRLRQPEDINAGLDALLRIGPAAWPSVAPLTARPPPEHAPNEIRPPLPSWSDEGSSMPPPPDEASMLEPTLDARDPSLLDPEAAARIARIWGLIDEGFTALRRGDRDRARVCWSEALDLDPADRKLRLNLRKLEAKG